MKMISVNFQFLVENSINPLLVFRNDGKVCYHNASAGLLAGIHLSAELFHLAVSYASKSFGSKTTYIDLLYGTDSFYAITVLYENEEELGLYLYRKPRTLIPKDISSFKGYSLTDISILLEANIELFKIKYNGELKLFADYSLPKFKLNQNHFSMLLRKVFDCNSSANTIDISLTIKIGASMVIDEKKYPIVILKIYSDKRDMHDDDKIIQMAAQSHLSSHFDSNYILLEIPCVDMESSDNF